MGEFLIAAAALKTPTRSGYNAQGVNLKLIQVRVNPRAPGVAPSGGMMKLGLPDRPALPPRPPRLPVH